MIIAQCVRRLFDEFFAVRTYTKSREKLTNLAMSYKVVINKPARINLVIKKVCRINESLRVLNRYKYNFDKNGK
jgi:hypothetical protein